jgi:hypothetical protein
MGVNVKCELAAGTRLKDVASVAAALLGNKAEHKPIDNSKGIFARVDGVHTERTSFLEMVTIVIKLDAKNPAAKEIIKSDGNPYHLTYHYESGPMGEPLLMPACTAAKIALCVGLVKFFGGKVLFNDCAAKSPTFRRERRTDIHAADNPWDHFQKRILAIKPLTAADVAKYEKYSGY